MIIASLIIQVVAAIITVRYVRKLPVLVLIFAAFGLMIIGIRFVDIARLSDFAVLLTSITMLTGVIVIPHVFSLIKQENKHLKSLEAIDHALLSSLSHKGLMNAIAYKLSTALNAEATAIFSFNHYPSQFSTLASNNFGQNIKRYIEQHVTNGFIASVIKNQRPMTIARIDTDEDDKFLQLLKAEGFNAFMCAPIIKGGVSIGILVLLSKQPKKYSRRDIAFAQAICSQIGIALNRAQLLDRIQEMNYESVRSLVEAIELRDPCTRGHSARVAELAVFVAQKMDFNTRELKYIEFAGLLHDVGKIAIPEVILQKKMKLNEEEWKIIKKHPVFSAQVVEPILELRHIVNWIRHHHERWDGNGYPEGRTGTQTPLQSRILAVCDTYSAMTSDRPYRKALHCEEAAQEIQRVAGTQLDPTIAALFLELHERGLSKNNIAGEHTRSTYPQNERDTLSYRPQGSWL